MRRIILTLLLLLLPLTARAETRYETVHPEDAGLLTSVTYGVDNIRWVHEFQYGDSVFSQDGDAIVVENETFLTCAYVEGSLPSAETAFADLAAFAEEILAAKPVFSVDWANGPVLLLPDGTEVAIPASEISQAYVRNQRLFLSLVLGDGTHLLRIVTWRDGLDVRDVPVPWAFWLDDYHAGEDGDDLCLMLDYTEEYQIYAQYADGRWRLSGFNTGREVYGLAANAVSLWLESYWAYGNHPWSDLETLDFATLPLTHTELLSHITREGWFFPTEDVTLWAAPSQEGDAPYQIPADTPLPVIRIEGEWAYVGIHNADEYGAEPITGYVPLANLSEMPVNVLPGGEQNGWFYTMTVKDGVLTFLNLRDEYDQYMSIPVESTFAAAARETYRQTGFAATPHRFDPALYPHIDPCVQFWETLKDVYIEGDKVVCAIDSRTGEHLLRIVTAFEPRVSYQEFVMPAPFHFDREGLYWLENRILLDQ